MKWTTPADLTAQVRRLWDKGDLLRARVTDEMRWPLHLRLRGPEAADLVERFEEVRAWSQALAAASGFHLAWREWNHRVQGRQRIPSGARVDSLDAALALIGKQTDVARFAAMWDRTVGGLGAVRSWLLRRPFDALAVESQWDRLLAVVAWLVARPRPGVYLRQVDVPGVDTKFIEAHRGILSSLWDLALPSSAVEAAATGAARFARRYGFAEPPIRIRFRLLDPSLPSMPAVSGMPDITLDAESFAAVAVPVERVVITENEVNFLALPAMARTIAVFGGGYGFEALAGARWLRDCRIQYWGDLDTHGFAILHQLRTHVPDVESVLMDHETLMAHREHWGHEPTPVRHELPTLTAKEAAVYDDLRHDRLQPNLRLEQERVRYRWAAEVLRST